MRRLDLVSGCICCKHITLKVMLPFGLFLEAQRDKADFFLLIVLGSTLMAESVMTFGALSTMVNFLL